MYLEGVELTVTWPLLNLTSSTVLKNTFNVVVVSPNGASTHYTDPTTNYVSPQPSATGSTSFVLTPTIQGVWRVLLVVGTREAYTVLASYEVPVRCAEDVAESRLTAEEAALLVLPTEVYRVRYGYIPISIIKFVGAGTSGSINSGAINSRAVNNVSL